MPVQTRAQKSGTDQLSKSSPGINDVSAFACSKSVESGGTESAVLGKVSQFASHTQDESGHLPPHGCPIDAKRNRRVIAIDFDDVIAQTNHTLNDWHNREYGTDIHISEWASYYPFRNRGWGTNAETTKKLTTFFDALKGTAKTPPVATVTTALKQLAAMGHPLHIVTSRPVQQRGCVEAWLAANDLGGVFTGMHFVGIYERADEAVAKQLGGANFEALDGEAAGVPNADQLLDAWAKNVAARGKMQVLREIGADLLIDDHIFHAEEAAANGMRSLLFGPYEWNRSRWGMDTPEDRYTYEERQLYGYERKREPDEEALQPGVDRALSWVDVIQWVRAWDTEACASPIA